jgi:hypothetical protein
VQGDEKDRSILSLCCDEPTLDCRIMKTDAICCRMLMADTVCLPLHIRSSPSITERLIPFIQYLRENISTYMALSHQMYSPCCLPHVDTEYQTGVEISKPPLGTVVNQRGITHHNSLLPNGT